MRYFKLLLWLLLCSAALPQVQAQQINLLEVGTNSQLLLDPALVFESQGVAFHPIPARKHADNPLMIADQACEGSYVSMFAGTVIYHPESKQFQMWYTGPGNPEFFPGGHYATFYATSRDGLKWEKPALETRRAKNGQPHNWISSYACPSVFFDPEDADEASRYKMVCFDEDIGYIALISPDGLTWKRPGKGTIVPISYVDDVISAFYDRRTKKYVALPKMLTPVFGRVRRSTFLSTSSDFREWSALQPAFLADRQDDLGSLSRLQQVRRLLHYPDNFHVMRTEFYGAAAYSAESCVVGFPWVFTISTNVPLPGNQDGPIDVQMAVSRDLETWSRPFRTPVVPLGKPGEWDGGMILTASQAIDVGEEVWLYYGGANHTHGAPPNDGQTTSIGLAVWQRDRFAAAAGSSDGGSLTTVPFKFSGERLEINAATKQGGEIRVEVLDAAGEPWPAFGSSAPISGDNLHHQVRFTGAGKLASLAGQPVRLKFHLKSAELYAFNFRPAGK